MTIGAKAERRARTVAFAALFAALLTGCPSRPKRTDSKEALCASACASLAASCHGVLDARCRPECEGARKTADAAGCQSEHDAYLACLSASRESCVPFVSLGSALEPGRGALGCELLAERYARCSAPCRERGVMRSASRSIPLRGRVHEVRAEQTTDGCGGSGTRPQRRSEPGSPCEASSVCTQFHCFCPRSRAVTLARACVDGRCADAALACEVVPLAVAYDACGGPPGDIGP